MVLLSIPFREATITHLDLVSTCIHQDSPEGVAQLEKEKAEINKNRRKSTVADVFLDENDPNKEKETRRKKVFNLIKLCSLLFTTFLHLQRRAKKAEKSGDGKGSDKKKTEKKRRASTQRRDSDYDREGSKPINHFFKQERATQTLTRYCKVINI